jgi:PEP-CTERM motif
MTCGISLFRTLLVGGCLACILMSTAHVHAAIVNRTILKSFYETGDRPTQQNFGNLIDSMINLPSDGFTYTGSIADPAGLGGMLSEGDEVGSGALFSGVAGLGEDWVGQSGFLGISLEINAQTHYGYLQITAAPGDQYPMFVEYFVYETQPNTPITTANVPEPGTLAFATLGLLGAGLRHRK